MKHFKTATNLKELKKEYKELAMANHPDRGGSEEIMKEINNEYELLTSILVKGDKEEQTAAAEAAAFKDIISKIINLDVTIEIVGQWIWVYGDTYPVKAQLKEAGFMWASKKKKWYYRQEDAKCSSRGKKSYEEIKEKYGASKVKTNKSKKYSLGA